jgi:predicted mannosyl-3-phosphoglycerate phosphatase (HAD superfamily)
MSWWKVLTICGSFFIAVGGAAAFLDRQWERQFDSLPQYSEAVVIRFNNIDSRLNGIDGRLGNLEKDVQTVKGDVKEILSRLPAKK